MEQELLSIENYKNENITKQYKTGLNYLSVHGYREIWIENIKFYDGDQWSKPTEDTKAMPRPVFNIIKYIVNHKVSSVLNDSVKMIFQSEEVADSSQPDMAVDPSIQYAMNGADMFTKYAANVWESIQQDSLNEELLFDGATLGTGILHYYWDNNVTGGVTQPYVGDIKGESLDPMNVFFGNPQEKRVQKQPYIIISSRELIENVRATAKNNGVPPEYIEYIKPDSEAQAEGYDSAINELDGTDKITVLTKYFKKDGFVYFTKVANDIVIVPETNTEIKLYPLVVMQYEVKKKSVHGNSDVRGLIYNQKGINFLLAMMLLSSQNTAFPKLLVKQGALKQEITNKAGEILIDHTMNGQDGIKYMTTGNFSPMTLTLVDKFIETTKTFSGATDSATGTAEYSNMAASAIMMLKQSASVPLEAVKKRFYRAIEDVGRIWEEFWKVKVNMPRAIKIKDEQGAELMQSFTGSDYDGMNFKLKIDVGAGGSYSESLAQSTLDRLFDKGSIDIKMYLKYSPKSAMPFKDSMLKDIEQKEQEALAMQQQQQMMEQQQMQDIYSANVPQM